MSISAVKPVAACRVVPVNRENGSDPKASRVDVLSRKSVATLQRKEMEKLLLQENSMSVSRREIMHLTALSLGLVSLISPLYAEASPRNVTMRQKIMRKLEELKGKASLLKPKDKEDKKPMSKDKSKLSEEEKKKSKDDEKDKKIQSKNGTPEPLPKLPLEEPPLIPSLPNILNDKTVETGFHP